MAERRELDVLKVSYAVLPYVLGEYALLPCGGALGRGCGPLVLTKEPGADLTGRTVAVPSEKSTAYLLFRLWAAEVVGNQGAGPQGPRLRVVVGDGRVGWARSWSCRSTRSCRPCGTGRSTPVW